MYSDFRFFRLDQLQDVDNCGDNAVYFDIYSDKAFGANSSEQLVVTAYSGDNTDAAVPISCVNGAICAPSSNCLAQDHPTLNTTRYDSTIYPEKTTIRVGFYPTEICKSLDIRNKTAMVAGCKDGAVLATVTGPDTYSLVSLKLKLVIGIANSTTGLAEKNAESSNVYVTSFSESPPLLKEQPSPTDFGSKYTPGDGLINVDPIAFRAESGSGGITPVFFFVTGNFAPDPDAPLVPTRDIFNTANQVNGLLRIGGGIQQIRGFQNTTDGNDRRYKIAFAAMNAGGHIGEFPADAQYTDIQTSAIQGFLKKGNCFIATAAFGSKESAPVRMLRQFRDRVLLKFKPGQLFVRWYYSWSPQAASWLERHPVFRVPVLGALLPVQIIAWLALHPLLVLCWAGMGFLVCLGLLARGRAISGRVATLLGLLVGFPLLAFGALNLAHAEEGKSVQPYIDSIKRELPQENTGTGTESYTESLKKKLGPSEAGTESGKSYTESLKSRLPPADESYKGYSEREKGKLSGTERGSAIAAVKEGKSQLKLKRPGQIRGAFGFKMSAVTTLAIKAGPDVAYQSYTQVFGKKYLPQLGLFGEFQPFHSEWFGNIGIFGSLGFSIQKGSGTFQFPPLKSGSGGQRFSSLSSTEFSFTTVPLAVGVNYRFNLLRYLRPYVQVGPQLVVYTENRNDGGQSHRGYSTTLAYGGGLNILLDWVSDTSAWALYESAEIKHTYLTLDYTRTSTMSGLVDFSTDIGSAGFTFEF